MRLYRIRFTRGEPRELVVRPLSRYEVIRYLPDVTSDKRSVRLAAEDAVFRRCVVDPTGLNVDSLRAGIVSRVLQVIIQVSGLDDQSDVVKRVKEWADTVDGRLEVLAMTYLGYKLHEIWSMDLEEWQYVMAAAAQAAALHGVDVQSFVNREQQHQSVVQPGRSQMARPVRYGEPGIEQEWSFQWQKPKK